MIDFFKAAAMGFLTMTLLALLMDISYINTEKEERIKKEKWIKENAKGLWFLYSLAWYIICYL